MTLLRDFSFLEPDGKVWTATAAHNPLQRGDLVIDGASIPPVFWSLIGGPYEGRYRNASIVHDAECTEPHRHRWQDVHRMFYRASLAGGTPELTAKLMFAAVWHFGPRWQMGEELYSPHRLTEIGDAQRLVEYIKRNPAISTADIEALSSEALAAAINDNELAELMRNINVCNDPNGPFLGARGDVLGDHRWSPIMSSPPEPCIGP
jgi:hypothetical protein